MRLATPGTSEHTLVTNFEYECGLRGSVRAAYLPVCASGVNSRYLHYTSNDSLLPAQSLVLFDAGCEYASYASDITRTFPTSGTFSKPEKDVYTVVLNTLKACIKLCNEKAGGATLYDLHENSKKTMIQELRQIGVDCGRDEALLGKIYPHFIGHPLGLDLHDCSTFQRHTR